MENVNHDLLKMYKRMLEIYKGDWKTHITKIWETEDMIESIERKIKAEQEGDTA